jgi:hypothetical protein
VTAVSPRGRSAVLCCHEEITLATKLATVQLNSRGRPWVWSTHHYPRAFLPTPSPYISVEGRSTIHGLPYKGKALQEILQGQG